MSPKPNKKLTPNQKIFADEWLKDRNGKRAYKIAYPSVKKDETARANASRLLTKANVKLYISAKLAKLADKTGVTQEYVTNGFKTIADWGLGLEDKQKAIKALENLGKHLGLYEKDNVQRAPVIVLDAESIKKGE